MSLITYALMATILVMVGFRWGSNWQKKKNKSNGLPQYLKPINNLIKAGIERPKALQRELQKQGIYLDVGTISQYKHRIRKWHSENT